jgi:hypothetical protein
VLQLFGSQSIAGGGWRQLSDGVPPYWAQSLAERAHDLASAWQQFAAHLDEVAKRSGEPLPGVRHTSGNVMSIGVQLANVPNALGR